MKPGGLVRRWWLVGWLGVELTAAAGLAEPANPTRLQHEEDGLVIEYSPEHDAYVEPLAAALKDWQQDLARRRAEPVPVPPLSAPDLVARRDEILAAVAAAIGLDRASALQEACFDTFANYYETLEEISRLNRNLGLRLATAPRAALWRRADVIAILRAGGSVPGFTYSPEDDALQVSFQFEGDLPKADENLAEAVATARLDHVFNYQVQDGVAEFAANVSFKPGDSPAAARRFDVAGLRANGDQMLATTDLVIPVRMERDGRVLSPEEAAGDHVRMLEGFRDWGLASPVRDAAMVLVILHETIEVGLVEHYIGSGDRRWLCDGTANLVAWQVARRLAGDEFGREVYDLPAQLRRVAALQPRIRLRRWPAVERQSEDERKTDLDRAHYPFATRAVAMMVERHGDDFLPRLWREIGRTPRRKVTMKTVERAYRSLTGERLPALIAAAEKNPIE